MVIIVHTMMERERGEAIRSGPMEAIKRVPAPATRDQTEGEDVGGISSTSWFGGGGVARGVASGGDTFEGLESSLGHLEIGGFWMVVDEVVGSGDRRSSAKDLRAVVPPSSRAEGGMSPSKEPGSIEDVVGQVWHFLVGGCSARLLEKRLVLKCSWPARWGLGNQIIR